MTDTERAERIAAARQLAATMATIGPDLRHLSDDELVEHVERFCERLHEAARAATLSAREATDAMRRLGQSLQQASTILEKMTQERGFQRVTDRQ